MSSSDHTITSVCDAVQKLRNLETDGTLYLADEAEIHKFPFGLWFRGHSRPVPKLEPRVFRDELSERDRAIVPVDTSAGVKGRWEESNVYEHLKLRVPVHEHTCHTAFDWLCLMQHYSVPTRLLDWSESLLPALYFAVKDDRDSAGELIALNAYRLNRRSKLRATISTPDDHHVVIRAEMATTRSFKRLMAKENVANAFERAKAEGRQREDWTDFLTPIAVFPRRLNERMTLQSSVFTIHGGKYYVPGAGPQYERDNAIIPPPVPLEMVDQWNPEQPVLRRYEIPQKCKGPIRRDLFLMGIHEGTLFPEVDRQAVYLQDCWWYGE